MSKHHILFIASWYPDKKNPTHGIFNRLFVEAASRHNRVSVLFVAPSEDLKIGYDVTVEKESDICTVRVYYRASHVRRSFVDKAIQYRRRMEATEKGFQQIKQNAGLPDLIHLAVVLPAGPAALHLSRKYSLPYVVNEGWTGYDPADGRYRGFISSYFTRKVISGASRILPVTSYLSDLMQKHGLRGNYEVVPNVVDTSTFLPGNNSKGEAPYRFIHVSALDDEQKNVSGILRAFSAALKDYPRMELLIVGEGEDKTKLIVQAASLGITSHVTFTGSMRPSQLAAMFNEANALVMFSNYETFCVVVPEALSSGIPVITSNAGGIMSYMDKSLGVIVPMRDEIALAKAMLDMAQGKHQFYPSVLRKFVVDRFSMEIIGERLKRIYNSVLDK